MNALTLRNPRHRFIIGQIIRKALTTLNHNRSVDVFVTFLDYDHTSCDPSISFDQYNVMELDNTDNPQEKFVLSTDIIIPGNRERPDDFDVVDIGAFPTLIEAVVCMLHKYAIHRIERAVLDEMMFLDFEGENMIKEELIAGLDVNCDVHHHHNGA